MDGTIRRYFTCANSSKGFVNFFASSLEGMDRIYILKGGPGTGKSTLMRKIGEHFAKKGEEIEAVFCSSDTSSLDGVILPDRRVAVVDGTAPHVIEPQAPGAVEEYVNLGEAWDARRLRPHKDEILAIKRSISECYEKVYGALREAKAVHDEWEAIYIGNTDYEKLEAVTKAFCARVLGSQTAEGKGRIIDRFFGATTPSGSIHYIDNLTDGLQKRYFIKGRPGTGKSTLLKRLAEQAKNRGFVVETYHCSFDPDSLDMVVLRQLGLCVFDATAPHSLEPSREQDEIIDLYEAAVKPGTDEAHAETLADCAARCETLTAQARETLGIIGRLHDDLEKPYIAAVDFHVLDRITKKLIKKIEKKS